MEKMEHEKISIRIGAPRVEICHVNGVFIASKSDADHLEKQAHVCINRTAELAENSSNWHYNSNLCQILDELVAVLVEFGIVDVFAQVLAESGEIEKRLLEFHEIPFPDTVEFRTRRLTVRDFWKKGYFIADGSRFGGHFLIYTSTPNECHAEFVVLCGPCSDGERIAAMRCCNQVKKTLLISTTSSDSLRPHYTQCTWFRPELH